MNELAYTVKGYGAAEHAVLGGQSFATDEHGLVFACGATRIYTNKHE